jgi:uncharacterized cofD-like protein
LNSSLVVLGRGRGLGSVLRTLREFDNPLTVIVATAECVDDGASSDSAGEPALSELRQSIEALTDDRAALARALRRPLTLDRLGSHPLGNLMLGSLAAAFGDLGVASIWLGDQLGIGGAVVPATVDPLSYVIEPERRGSRRTDSGGGPELRRLRLIPERPQTSLTALDAIAEADLIVMAPGTLFAGVLAVSAIPAIRQAVRAASARVVWIGNPQFQEGDSLLDQLDALHRHQVRVDAVMFDPDTDPAVPPDRLVAQGVEAIPRKLGVPATGEYSYELLGAALTELLATPPASAPDGSQPTSTANGSRRAST